MNRIEETLRVLDKQVDEYSIRVDSFSEAYDEFSLKCQHTLEKEVFDFISSILYKALKFYEVKLDESREARNEILEKYDIPHTIDEEKV